MGAENQNFSMNEGETRDLQITIFDLDADPTGNTRKDLTNVQSITWNMCIGRNCIHNNDPIITKTLGEGITLVDASQGEIAIAIDLVDTDEKQGVYWHQATVVDTNSKTSTVTTGRATIKS